MRLNVFLKPYPTCFVNVSLHLFPKKKALFSSGCCSFLEPDPFKISPSSSFTSTFPIECFCASTVFLKKKGSLFGFMASRLIRQPIGHSPGAPTRRPVCPVSFLRAVC